VWCQCIAPGLISRGGKTIAHHHVVAPGRHISTKRGHFAEIRAVVRVTHNDNAPRRRRNSARIAEPILVLYTNQARRQASRAISLALIRGTVVADYASPRRPAA